MVSGGGKGAFHSSVISWLFICIHWFYLLPIITLLHLGSKWDESFVGGRTTGVKYISQTAFLRSQDPQVATTDVVRSLKVALGFILKHTIPRSLSLSQHLLKVILQRSSEQF